MENSGEAFLGGVLSNLLFVNLPKSRSFFMISRTVICGNNKEELSDLFVRVTIQIQEF